MEDNDKFDYVGEALESLAFILIGGAAMFVLLYIL